MNAMIINVHREGKSPRKVEAKVVGDLAVHLGEKSDLLQVTHVPTGLSFASALPEAMAEKRANGSLSDIELLLWCKEVQTKQKADWAAVKKLSTDDVVKKNLELKLRDRLKAMCQKVIIKPKGKKK